MKPSPAGIDRGWPHQVALRLFLLESWTSMGRSRGGLTSKIHALVDTNGLPIRLALTAGKAHDNRLAPPPGEFLAAVVCAVGSHLLLASDPSAFKRVL